MQMCCYAGATENTVSQVAEVQPSTVGPRRALRASGPMLQSALWKHPGPDPQPGHAFVSATVG